MPLNPGLLDTSILRPGPGLDVGSVINTYTGIKKFKTDQKLSEITLSAKEKELKRDAEIQGIIKSSITQDGHVNSEKAIMDLNRAGFLAEAEHIQGRMETARATRQAAEAQQAKDMASAFLNVVDSKNPVESFLLAREEGKKNGWKMSPGIMGYNPSDEELASGKFANPKVGQELLYHGERFLTPDQRIARAKSVSGADSGDEYGLNPIYGVDAQGNAVALQASKKGGVKKIELPEGISLTPGVNFQNVGDKVIIFDKSGKQVASVKKGVDPGKQADLAISAEELKLKQAEGLRKAAEAESKKVEVAKKARAYSLKNKGEIESLQTFLDKANTVKDNPNMKYVTGAGKVGAYIPGTSAADLQADIDFLVSSGVIETMSKLKNESPTGATGFGALSENEMKVMQNAFSILGNRDISPNKKREELGRVIKIIENRQREYRAFARDSDTLLGPEPTEQETIDNGIDGL